MMVVEMTLRTFREGNNFCLNPSFNGWWSLRFSYGVGRFFLRQVLILLLMDDGRWVAEEINYDLSKHLVLILLLMDDGRWVSFDGRIQQLGDCLNPSFNGWWSLRQQKRELTPTMKPSLNPSFNGWWSLRPWSLMQLKLASIVLILLLMDDGRWGTITLYSIKSTSVLILLLMDDGRWEH